MDFELRLERPGQLKPWLSAIVMGLAYFLGECWPSIRAQCQKKGPTRLPLPYIQQHVFLTG